MIHSIYTEYSEIMTNDQGVFGITRLLQSEACACHG